MKLKILWISLIIIVLSFPLICSSEDWVEYDRSKNGNVFLYNKVKIKHLTNGIVQVWEKLIFSDEGREEELTQKNRGKNILTEGDENISYHMNLYEVDCKKEMLRSLSMTEYNTDGKILDSTSSSSTSYWNYIVPNSIGERLYQQVCVTQKEETPKVKKPMLTSDIKDSKVWESFSPDLYYNKTNITKSSDIISVWTYIIVTYDERKKKIDEERKKDLEKSIKYQNYDHYLGLWEIDSINKQRRLIELTDYDDKGNILDRDIYKDSEWNNIKPNSVFEKLYIKVGVTQNEPLAKEPLVKEQLKKEPLITPGMPDSKVWEYFSDNIYYNKTNITKSSGIISVWTYNIVTDDFRKHKIEEIKKNNLEKSIKYQHYDHNVVLWGIDCKERRVGQEKIIYYNDKRKVIDVIKSNNSEWERIVPGSIGENLYEKFCITRKKSIR